MVVARVWPSPEHNEGLHGQVLRSVKDHGKDGRPIAVIASAETGDWNSMPREDPMAFVYLFYERPLSEVIASASRFSSKVVERGGEQLYHVSVEGAQPGRHALEFLFDNRFLQRERMFKVWYGGKHDDLKWNNKLVFSGYRFYDMPSGEPIWFPAEVTYTGYSMVATAPMVIRSRFCGRTFTSTMYSLISICRIHCSNSRSRKRLTSMIYSREQGGWTKFNLMLHFFTRMAERGGGGWQACR